MKLVWRILLLYHPMTMYMWLNSFLQLTKAERGISYCFHICASHSDVGKYRLYILAFMFNLLGINIKYHGPDIKEVSDSIYIYLWKNLHKCVDFVVNVNNLLTWKSRKHMNVLSTLYKASLCFVPCTCDYQTFPQFNLTNRHHE